MNAPATTQSKANEPLPWNDFELARRVGPTDMEMLK